MPINYARCHNYDPDKPPHWSKCCLDGWIRVVTDNQGHMTGWHHVSGEEADRPAVHAAPKGQAKLSPC